MSHEQDAVAEFTRNVGREQPDREWILSQYDTWERNPFYSGPPGRHPNEDEDERGEPQGCAHEWAYTGTAYGGDDERWHGEGRCYCIHCGADGDA
jgi:hypothetical protein